MTQTVGIFGASGFAREVADIAIEIGYDVVYVAQNQREAEMYPGHERILLENEAVRNPDLVFAVGIGDNSVRQKIWERYRDSLSFVNLIHPSATFGHRQLVVIKGQIGVVVCAGVRFTNNISVGDFSIFNLNVTVGHDVTVGRFTNLAPGAHISGNVTIEPGSWIGTGAVINQGEVNRQLTIGRNTVVGSGSVVTKDCQADSVYAGVPARKMK